MEYKISEYRLKNSFSIKNHLLIKVNGSNIRGRNNGRSTDMTGQILRFVRPEFSVITEMTGHFFLERVSNSTKNI